MSSNKFIVASILFAINAVVLFVFVIPQYHESKELEVIAKSKEESYENQMDHRQKILAALSQIESRTETLSKVENALPSEFAFAPIVYFLQTKAGESDLAVNSLTFSKSTQKNAQTETEEVRFTVMVSGRYQAFKQFLSAVEKSSRLFEVENISFNSLSGQVSLLENYTFAVEIKTHAY